MSQDSERRPANEPRVDDGLSRHSVRRAPPLPALVGTGVLATIAVALLAIVLLRPTTPAAVADTSPTPAPTPSPTNVAVAPTPSAASPSATSSPSPTPAPTPSAALTPAPIPSGPAFLGWTEGVAPRSNVHDVTWLRDRWLAVGSLDGRAAIWTSTDGLTWTPSAEIDPDPVPVPEGGRAYWINSVIGFGDEMLAFGWNRIGCCDGGRAAMWRSADGVSWVFVDSDGTPFGDMYHFPIQARIGPSGDLVLLSGIGLGSGATIWTSADGSSWTEQPQPLWVEEPLVDLAAGPSLLMTVGYRGPFEERPVPAVWTSTDGRTWTSQPGPSTADEIRTVAYDPTRERFVTGGQDVNGAPAMWLSSDGMNWTTVRLSQEAGAVTSVDAAAGLVVATGYIGTDAGPWDGTVWSSHDGVTWAVAPLGPPGAGTPFVAAGDGAVTWFNAADPDDLTVARVWHGATQR